MLQFTTVILEEQLVPLWLSIFIRRDGHFLGHILDVLLDAFVDEVIWEVVQATFLQETLFVFWCVQHCDEW